MAQEKSGPIRTPNGVEIIYADKFYCTYCPMVFRSLAGRKGHECYHEGRRYHFCEDCHASFYQKHHLVQHKKACSKITQLGENIKWCDFCDHFYKTDERLINHYCKAHGILYDPKSTQKYKQSTEFAPAPVVCDLCGLSFQTKFSLGTHKYAMHRAKEIKIEETSSKNEIRIPDFSHFLICSDTDEDDST